MKIVVLDAETLNPGDLSWDGFKEHGDLFVYSNSDEEEIIERAVDADIIVTNKVVINKSVIDRLRSLKLIAETATGFNNIDVEYARLRGVDVVNVPTYATESVVQMAFAHILNFACRFNTHVNSVKRGDWVNSESFCYNIEPLFELNEKTIGIIGFGNTGRRLSDIAKSFGMNVIVYHYKKIDEEVKQVTLEELASLSDFISLHIPYNEDTNKIINSKLISLMKPGVFLINISRGGLVDEASLAKALNDGRLGGAGVDVLSKEPPEKSNPMLSAKNVFMTPHNCWSTLEARKRLISISLKNVSSWINKEKTNLVN